MFGIGGFELFIILLFGFLVFGPDKLPEIARTVGLAIGKFKKAQEEMESVIKDEVLDVDQKKSSKPQAAPVRKASPDESFAERKARYDAERAERARIEENRTTAKQQAQEVGSVDPTVLPDASQADDLGTFPSSPEDEIAANPGTGVDVAVKPAVKPTAPSLTPDELFGTVPVKPAPRAARVTTDVDASKGGE